LHICFLDKFIPPFISFVKEHFEFDDHVFALTGDKRSFPIAYEHNVTHFNTNVRLIILIWQMYTSRKIILHGIFDPRIVKILALQPWLLRKCYWVMWGGDLYHYKLRDNYPEPDKYEAIRSFVIKRIGHFVSCVRGDYELAKQWYGVTGPFHECMMYPSNIFRDLSIPSKTTAFINILVGNSGDPTNNHLEVLHKIAALNNRNIVVYCPLSYNGTKEYVKEVVETGVQLFESNFVALLQFMPISKYIELLGPIDIAVFAHKRQQAMGNTVALLGMGKKVYIRSDVTQWATFQELGIKVFDFLTLDLEPLSEAMRNHNISQVKAHFNSDNLVRQLSELFS
jgi:dTDP-N-acetylfucosamine:lipid II N-acetylfucosaminyltransferase